jgi:hypothetical protein
MTYTVDFPDDVDVFYWDYIIEPTQRSGINKIIVFFEHDTRRTTKFVGHTTRSNADWREFQITEEEQEGKRKLIFKI